MRPARPMEPQQPSPPDSETDEARIARLTRALADVTAAKEAELALLHMSERFERAVDAGEEGLFERAADEDAMFLSDRLVHLLGYAPGELAQRRSTLIELMHVDDQARYRAQ